MAKAKELLFTPNVRSIIHIELKFFEVSCLIYIMGIKALLWTVTEPQTESDINTCRFTDIVKNFLKKLYPVFFIITIPVKHLFVVCIESGMDKHSFFHEGFINKKKLLHSLTDKIGFDQVIQIFLLCT